MRRLAPLLLLAACLVLHGCLGSVLGTIVAPEAVVAGTAVNAVNEGVGAINGAAEAANTAADLDRIIANNPEAVNIGELRALSGELDTRSIPNQAAAPAGPPPPRDEFDRRLPPEATGDGAYHVTSSGGYRNVGAEHHGTVLVVQREVIDDLGPQVGRREVRPFTYARVSSLPPLREPIYQYGWNPDPQPLEARRGAE
jgi:hypothetical protein